jgi:hypothetical protein
MASDAQENGLVELRLERTPASKVRAGNVEGLGFWVDVVKRERAEQSRVSTEQAAPTLVLNHAALERDTINSAVAAAGVADALRVTSAMVVFVHARTYGALANQPPVSDAPRLTHRR